MPKNLSKTSKTTSANNKTTQIKKTDYEEFGRFMVRVFETGYFNKSRLFKYSFLKGVAGGFGSVVGATIVVALVLWILSFFDSLPLIDNFVSTIDKS